jgi:hypothetical protein
VIALLLGNYGRFIAYGVVIVAALTVAEMHGYYRGKTLLYEYQAEQAKAAVRVVVKQGAVTEKIVTQYRDRVRWVREVPQIIEKEIVRYVPPSADPVLPLGWVLLHDSAAVGQIPQATAGVDVAAPGIAASQAVKGVIENYGACKQTALQLVTLQGWIEAQYQVMNLEALEY